MKTKELPKQPSEEVSLTTEEFPGYQQLQRQDSRVGTLSDRKHHQTGLKNLEDEILLSDGEPDIMNEAVRIEYGEFNNSDNEDKDQLCLGKDPQEFSLDLDVIKVIKSGSCLQDA